MSIEPRPKLRTPSSKAMGVLFLLGLAIYFGFRQWGPPTRLIPHGGASPERTIGESHWSDVGLLLQGHWLSTLGLGIALSMVTVSVFEILKTVIQIWDYRRSAREAFDQFFGDDASERAKDGVILLQADRIEDLLSPFVDGPSGALASPDRNRFYKARAWVNRFDAEGARAVTEGFRERGCESPTITTVDHAGSTEGPSKLPADAPFGISMGLGFTDETLRIMNEVCRPWLRINQQTPDGDVVELDEHLVPANLQRLATSRREEGFARLVPRDWDVTKWLQHDAQVRDYAVILRHTTVRRGKRQVFFVLAGFTECGTAAAGRYLAARWHLLWNKYVKGHLHDASLGDFLIVIEGPSRNLGEGWEEDYNLPAITPGRLHEHRIGCEWSKRFAS